jgi:hypothetical protein
LSVVASNAIPNLSRADASKHTIQPIDNRIVEISYPCLSFQKELKSLENVKSCLKVIYLFVRETGIAREQRGERKEQRSAGRL